MKRDKCHLGLKRLPASVTSSNPIPGIRILSIDSLLIVDWNHRLHGDINALRG